MSSYIHPDPDRTYACPECDTGGDVRVREDLSRSNGDEKYRCGNCEARFDNPVDRPKRYESRGGTAQSYDPDNIPKGIKPEMKEQIRALRGEMDG